MKSIDLHFEEIKAFFTSTTGSNNRQWVKRYLRMISNYKMLKDSTCNDDFLSGYYHAMKSFHSDPDGFHEAKNEEKQGRIGNGFYAQYIERISEDHKNEQ
jgi:hypothetical protein